MRIWIFCFLLLTACSQTPSVNRQIVRANLSFDPASLDPRKARDLDSLTVLRMLFEGLTRFSKEGKAELALAKEVAVSEDGLSYTFVLRQSKWSNGIEVTAYDFEKSWKTVLDPNFPTDIAYNLYVLKGGRDAKMGKAPLEEVGVKALDAFTLRVDLEYPIPYLLELLTLPSFFPVCSSWVEAEPKWAFSPSTFVCNGPFLLANWAHGNCLAASKNKNYWDEKTILLEEIDLVIASPDTGLKMFEEKKIDWTGSPLSVIPPEAVQSLKESGALQIKPFAATYFYRVNTAEERGGKPNPLANAKLRKALALAIDRLKITTHILQGGQTPALSLVPKEMGLFSSLQEEKTLIDEIRGTVQEPIVISYINSERNASIAQAVQQQWEKALAIEVRLEAVESKVFFQKISEKEYQIAAGSWTADFNDPVNFLEVFKYKEASTNNTGWENSEYIDLLTQSQVCTDLEERRDLLARAEEILLEDMPIIPIFHFTQNFVKKEGLEGVFLSSLGQIDFRWAHWEKSGKR